LFTEEEFVEGEEVESTTIERILSVITPSTIHVEPDLEERSALDDWRKLNRGIKLASLSIPKDYKPTVGLWQPCQRS
jgi:hypothetical protein